MHSNDHCNRHQRKTGTDNLPVVPNRTIVFVDSNAEDRRAADGASRWTPFVLWAMTFLFWGALGAATGALRTPLRGDEGDYFGRGLALATHGFDALSDGYRPPALPMLVSLFSRMMPSDAMVPGMRVTGVAAVAVIPALWWRAGTANAARCALCRVMAIATALWPPFYLLSYWLMAEAWCFVLWNLVLIRLFVLSEASRSALPTGLLVGIGCGLLTLFKANTLTTGLSAILVLLLSKRHPRRYGILTAGIAICTTTAIVLPWVVFVRHNTGRTTLATSQGPNLLVGTGYHLMNMQPDAHALPERYIRSVLGERRWSPLGPTLLDDEDIAALSQAEASVATPAYVREPARTGAIVDSAEPVRAGEPVRAAPISDAEPARAAAIDRVTCALALRQWAEHPDRQFVHGLLKVVHSLGGSLRGPMDAMLFAMLLASLLATVRLRRIAGGSLYVRLHWLAAASGMFLAFFYLPNIRFKVFSFDTTALLLLSASLTHSTSPARTYLEFIRDTTD